MLTADQNSHRPAPESGASCRQVLFCVLEPLEASLSPRHALTAGKLRKEGKRSRLGADLVRDPCLYRVLWACGIAGCTPSAHYSLSFVHSDIVWGYLQRHVRNRIVRKPRLTSNCKSKGLGFISNIWSQYRNMCDRGTFRAGGEGGNRHSSAEAPTAACTCSRTAQRWRCLGSCHCTMTARSERALHTPSSA